MNLDDLIAILIQARNDYGNLPVNVVGTEDSGIPLKIVRIKKEIVELDSCEDDEFHFLDLQTKV
jgi:hypothetical protein